MAISSQKQVSVVAEETSLSTTMIHQVLITTKNEQREITSDH